MSVPQMPHAATLIKTSLDPTSGTGTSSTRTTPLSRYTPARMVLGIGPSVRRESIIEAALLMRACRGPLSRNYLRRETTDKFIKKFCEFARRAFTPLTKSHQRQNLPWPINQLLDQGRNLYLPIRRNCFSKIQRQVFVTCIADGSNRHH